MKIVCVVSARPNFMKIAPILEAFETLDSVQTLLVHTGQHYDDAMSGVFFRELGLPEPDVNLNCGGSGVEQTARMMTEFEKVCRAEKPDGVVVVGDVNGTLATAFVASRLYIPLAHVEAGLRSFDRTMPEEINRIVVDQIADLLFCTERDAVANLEREGIPRSRICLVGNVMIDSLFKNYERAQRSGILERLGIAPKSYVVATLHRPALVDCPEAFARVLDAFDVVLQDTTIVWPVHPRARKNIARFGLDERLRNASNLLMIEPLGYLDFLKLYANSTCVLTDSGGLQEETTALKIPCVTIRNGTERPITQEIGTNQIAGLSTEGVVAAWRRVVRGEFGERSVPELWDGHAAGRVAMEILRRWRPNSDSTNRERP